MKNKLRLGMTLVVLSTLVACTRTAHFYPVQGPLSSQNPAPVYSAKVSFGANPKTLSVILGNGEVCKGSWSVVPRDKSRQTTAGTTGGADNLQADWDTVYGAGFFVAHVLGARYYAKTTATGDRGTVLTAEMYRPENAEGSNLAASVKGVARDNNGNVYKLVVQ